MNVKELEDRLQQLRVKYNNMVIESSNKAKLLQALVGIREDLIQTEKKIADQDRALKEAIESLKYFQPQEEATTTQPERKKWSEETVKSPGLYTMGKYILHKDTPDADGIRGMVVYAESFEDARRVAYQRLATNEAGWLDAAKTTCTLVEKFVQTRECIAMISETEPDTRSKPKEEPKEENHIYYLFKHGKEDMDGTKQGFVVATSEEQARALMAWRCGDGSASKTSAWNNPRYSDCTKLDLDKYSPEIFMVSTNDRPLDLTPSKGIAPPHQQTDVKRTTYVLSRFGEDKDGVCRVAVMATNENRARYLAATRCGTNYPVQAWLDKTQSDCIEYPPTLKHEAMLLTTKDRTRMG